MKNLFILLALLVFVSFMSPQRVMATDYTDRFFPVQSIDTMKYSRDRARNEVTNVVRIDIDQQIGRIAATGATHIAIATPYDEEFFPYMKMWVDMARAHGLHVWFRGNFSGWEKWFDYPKIDRETHTNNVIQFINAHPDMFQDGDIFTSCPECENGGPGDPRQNGDVDGHRQFLIHEYQEVKKAFARINKHVTANYYSMNGDVARLVMDHDTTAALDGIVTVDHYVASPDKLVADLKEMAAESGGKIVLGEFGAPIPDIHGDMTQTKQADWVESAYDQLYKMPEIAAVNYWVDRDGSSSAWSLDGTPRKVASVITKYYKPSVLRGTVKDQLDHSLDNVTVNVGGREVKTVNGAYTIPFLEGKSARFSKDGYISTIVSIPPAENGVSHKDIILQPRSPSFLYNMYISIRDFIRNLLER